MKPIYLDRNWSKKNLMTLRRGKKLYDEYEHVSGVVGKRYYMDSYIELTDREYDKFSAWMKANNHVGATIVITNCRACGKQFENLLKDSIHTVIPAPEGEKEDSIGVWVMGVGEPVKVLNGEFLFVEVLEQKAMQYAYNEVEHFVEDVLCNLDDFIREDTLINIKDAFIAGYKFKESEVKNEKDNV